MHTPLTYDGLQLPPASKTVLLKGKFGNRRVEIPVTIDALDNFQSLAAFTASASGGLFSLRRPDDVDCFKRDLRQARESLAETGRVEFSFNLSPPASRRPHSAGTKDVTRPLGPAAKSLAPVAPPASPEVTATADGTVVTRIGRWTITAGLPSPVTGDDPIHLSVQASRRAELLSRTALGRRVLATPTAS